MFADSPGLHAVDHAVYDVWLTDCRGAAEEAAKKAGDSFVTVERLLLALAIEKSAATSDILAKAGVTPTSLNQVINDIRKGRTADSANAEQGFDALKKYARDLTAEARAPREGAKRELDFILDIPLDVSAELGRTKLLINELLQLGQGSVIELNKLAGEPLELYVNGKLVARGEAVVINEKFGVRLTDIVTPSERMRRLSRGG